MQLQTPKFFESWVMLQRHSRMHIRTCNKISANQFLWINNISVVTSSPQKRYFVVLGCYDASWESSIMPYTNGTLAALIVGHCCVRVPRTCTRLGNRAFPVAGPRLWNSLRSNLRQSDLVLLVVVGCRGVTDFSATTS